MTQPEPFAVTGYNEAMEAKAALARQQLRHALDALAGIGGPDLYESMAALGEASVAASSALSMIGSALQSAEGSLSYEQKPSERTQEVVDGGLSEAYRQSVRDDP
jgi:hypothetical protein